MSAFHESNMDYDAETTYPCVGCGCEGMYDPDDICSNCIIAKNNSKCRTCGYYKNMECENNGFMPCASCYMKYFEPEAETESEAESDFVDYPDTEDEAEPEPEEETEHETEPIVVKKMYYEGKPYLQQIHGTNIYSYESYRDFGKQLLIGVWNNETGKIDFK